MPELRAQIERIIEVFSQGELGAAVALFREDACYETVSGSLRRGRDAIARELAPQFRGAYGAMQFHLARVIVDEARREAAIAWTCEHQLDAPTRPLARVLRVVFGPRASWEGVDLFRFDEQGLIEDKRTFAKARLLAIR
ncbi:MAG TPA: nuclear transport factor 2 family protein [Polyangiales bacterium]|nr:nuclear transport factor 2 family protein [Polyangiales bacterium]